MGTVREPLIDPEIVRGLYVPGGDWAKTCGDRVRRHREQAGWTLAQLAQHAGTTVQTVYKIERGLLVPREYLKAAIAFALHTEVADIWRPISRTMLAKFARSAA